MTDEKEAAWCAEFEKFGETLVQLELTKGFFPEPKRQAAFRWLGEKARTRSLRETQTLQYVRWTLWAAVAAVIVGVVGVVVTLFH